jgi:hypothetical protein
MPDSDGPPANRLSLRRDELAADLERLIGLTERAEVREQVAALQERLESAAGAAGSEPGAAEIVHLRRDVLLAELEQIASAQTVERARYYLVRLRKGLLRRRTSAVNDINLLRWKEYDEVLTDSLWSFPKRDRSGAHDGDYWGNFVPQIPRQLMLRYTRKGDWVLDAFLGSGTTLIECRELGRNGLGIELNAAVAARACARIESQPNPHSVETTVLTGDSRTVDLQGPLTAAGVERVQLALLHPPYHDIIRFSDAEADLSGAASTAEFLRMFGEVVDNVTPRLEDGRYLAVVIGDKYVRGEWVPLGFQCMEEVLRRGYRLKSIVVKNFEETRAKRKQQELWRYRALAGGFYVFKHEYVLIFRKRS